MLSVGDMRTIGNFRREVTDAPQISDAQHEWMRRRPRWVDAAPHPPNQGESARIM